MSQNNNSNFMDRVTDLSNKISEPLVKISNNDIVASIVGALQSIIPITIIGSLFMVLYVLGSPNIGTSGEPLISFLEPLASEFLWFNSVTLGFLALYASVAIPMNYAERKNLNMKSSALIGLGTFLLFTIGGFDDAGGVLVDSFAAQGLFAAMISGIVSVLIYEWCIERDFTIKMPDSVPPNISNAFTSIIPYGISFTLAWLVRNILNFDIIAFLNSALAPFISGADNIWFVMIATFIALLLWSVGLHGDSMFLLLFQPIGLVWLEENVAALSSGTAATDLPNVLAGFPNTLNRLTIWPAAVWPLIALMLLSSNKFLKTLGITSLGPGIFTIIEPVIYGLPIALNPYLMVPFILSGTISSGVGYLLMATPWMNKFYALLPWATPPFLLGPLGTGSWLTIIIVIVSFVIGLLIYLPFWRIFVKQLNEGEFATDTSK